LTSIADEELDDLLVVEETEPEPARRRPSRWMIALLVAFVVTRGIAGYVADHPGVYGDFRADGTGDVNRYDQLSWDILRERKDPYGADVQMEYPPGAIPVIMVPRVVRLVSYRTEFVTMMVLVDALGLLGLVRIARRTGSWWGAATWFFLVPLLGVVSYARFDLVVAVLLVWTLERALAGRWHWVGLLIGIGAAVKLVPIVLLPLLFFVAPREKRRALVGWCGAVVGLTVLPFVGRLPDVYRSVVTYHTGRGIEAESIWGAGVMVARWVASYPVAIVGSHRAWDAQAGVSELLKTLSSVAAAAVVLVGIVLAIRTRVGDVRRASILVFAVMSLLVGFGKVYSPQYIVWLIALGAVAMSVAPRKTAPAVVTLAVVTVLAHLLFPYWFWDLLFYDKGGALAALAVRNLLTIVTGGLALWAWRSPRPAAAA